MTTTKLYSYRNGNCDIEIFSDGTKYRTFEGAPAAEYPESIDLKVTDYCDAGCAFCHEKSTIRGEHGDLVWAAQMLKEIPINMEVAIGGGDPLSHPDIIPFLKELKQQNKIPNLTVNHFHVEKYKDLIPYLRSEGLLYGLGLSYNKFLQKKRPIQSLIDNNTVIHFILGVHSTDDMLDLLRTGNYKALLLGYKKFGRGEKFFSGKILSGIADTEARIREVSEACEVLSFDNLAIEQLRMQEKMKKSVWDERFMGQDGSHTMYVDAIKKEYALSSTTIERAPMDSLKNAFKSLV